MGKFTDSLLRRFGYVKHATAQVAARNYAAAAVSRLTSSWTTTSNSVNADLYRDLDVLRARSRDLAKNNPYGRKFLSLVGANMVGPNGFRLQATVADSPTRPDKGACDAIETAWERWCARGVCDRTGRMSFRDMCDLLARTTARDGEFLVRKVLGRSAGNAFGYALQVLDVDRIDTKLNQAPEKNTNQIRMGVEIDAWGRPLALWLRTAHPGDLANGSLASTNVARHERIPVDELLHGFIADRPEQLRGLPWMHASMTQINNLGGYEEAAIIASRVGASKMGFFRPPEGEDLTAIADGETSEGVPYTDAEPGAFGVLPKGYDFTPFNPDYPTAMFADFVKAALRGVASGLDVSYNTLGNDLEGVNFSSIRAGVLEERDLWMAKQQWFISAFLEPVFADWLKLAISMGQIRLPNNSTLPIEKLDKFSAHTWQPRRWQWVDPMKDIEAARVAIQTGVASPQMIAAQNGVDVEDVLDQIGIFEERVREKNIASVSLAAKNAPPLTSAAPDPAATQEA